MHLRHHAAWIGLLTAFALAFSAPVHAQGLGNLLKKASQLDLGGSLRGHKEQITTSLKDATFADPSRDGFQPPVKAQPLATLRQAGGDTFLLRPGYYTMQAQSYCLHAGTYGPGKGEGYLYAPPLGPAKDLITTIARNSALHPEVNQHDVQALIWAVLARAGFRDLNPELQRTARTLLSSEQMAAQLRGAAFDMVRERATQELMGRAPPQLRAVLDAEARLRSMFATGYSSFAELEQVAILAGMAPIGVGSQDIPSGRWSRHPDGYWVRYIPSGYSSTRLEVFVEPGSTATGRVFDPALHVAVPGNTARQRLLQSARSH